LAFIPTVFGGSAVFGTTPSCSHLRQSRSNCDVASAAAVAAAVGAAAAL